MAARRKAIGAASFIRFWTLASSSLNAPGSGYAAGDKLTPSQVSSTSPTVWRVYDVGGGGAILVLEVASKGMYAQTPITNGAVKRITGTGTGATVNSTWIQKEM